MTADPRRPTIVVVHGPGSAGPRDVLRAARGWADLVFLVNPDDSNGAADLPMLSRLARVVQDRPDTDVLAELRALAPVGITTFGDARIARCAELAAGLGLPYHSRRTAELLSDKVRQRAALNAAGVSPTRVEAAASTRELPAAAEKVGYPVVVKPASGNSSRWTGRYDDSAALDALIRAAAADPAAPACWIVEELLPAGRHPYGDVLADFVSVESVVEHGRITHFAVTDRLALAPPFRERGLLLPTLLAPDETEPVLALASAALAALDVRWGVTHTEIKLTPEGPRVIEVNGRLGGWVGELMRRTATVDPVRVVLDVAAGRPADLGGLAFRAHAAVLLVQPPEGRFGVTELADPAVFRTEPGVWQVWRRAEPGDVVDSRSGSLQMLYAVYTETDRAGMSGTLRRLDRIGRDAALLQPH
ncbi:carbamoyl-phosphate synthase L subunit-like protein [Krasilnikovia cinnamomea]|uniref:Carbamoyl-phosphate synthase L subunit-like protein n=1 Tax=Krasilnikovia cinnamomea TaxID=349313 RepID=A0A4Q7ZK79_9ACTN|nr:hypothetical protein [Krasilnikovia cinnamomea]RZU50934.1 carbamoyl-phosphate synthase L subunit-like protein [Krasilnikovia cinnamomea]